MSLQKDAKNCYKCGLQTASSAKFCTQCGADLEVTEKPTFKDCPECGSQMPSKSNFCENCGVDLKSKDSSKVYSDKSDSLKPLYCERGCGGVLLETDDPGIFSCKYCGRKYLVKREGASLKIVKEIKEIKDNLEGLTDIQKKFAEKENAKIDLDELEEKNDSFCSSFFIRLLKVVRTVTLPMGVVFFLISLLFSLASVTEATTLFKTSIVCFVLYVFSLGYLWRHKMQYQRDKKELLRIINRRI